MTMSQFARKNHVSFVANLGQSKDQYFYWITEHIRMSGVYWTLTSLSLLGESHELASPRSDLLAFLSDCYDPETGAFGANKGMDPHILYTLSALQILALLDALDEFFEGEWGEKGGQLRSIEKLVNFIAGLQQPDGSFAGDEWGEIDTRFSYCAIQSLKLILPLLSNKKIDNDRNLKSLDDVVDVERAIAYILSCQNFDGGFGSIVGAESHAGQIFCCVGTLAMTDSLDRLEDRGDKLAWWLSERQLDSCGGLNGRPEKLEDVCYSWWVLSSLLMLGRSDWIDGNRLRSFILSCQDDETGGFSDRPGNVPDIFHTLFGLASLSMLDDELLNSNGEEGVMMSNNNNDKKKKGKSLAKINPIYCLPLELTNKLNLS